MSLPTTLNIFGQTYKVKPTNLIETMGALGLCDRKDKVIYIDNTVDEREQYCTLLHEMGHAVFSRVSLVQAVDAKLEEVIVDTLATAIIENFDFS